MDSVGSNDMQQSDMNHPTPSLPPSPPSSPARCAAAHSQRASDTIYGKRKTRCGHLSIDGLSETTLFKKKKKKKDCRTLLELNTWL